MRTLTSADKQTPRVWLVLAILAYLTFIGRSAFGVDGDVYFSLFDDAMISMRYARNLAAGDGFVWNAGEPPVEGYTNLLWTLWMVVTHSVGVPESKTSLVVMLTGVGLLVALARVSANLAYQLSDGSPLAACATWRAVAFYYPLVF